MNELDELKRKASLFNFLIDEGYIDPDTLRDAKAEIAHRDRKEAVIDNALHALTDDPTHNRAVLAQLVEGA